MGSEEFDWHFGHMLQDHTENQNWNDFALVILNQPLTDLNTLRRLWVNAKLRVAADGGANQLLDAARSPKAAPVHDYDNLDVIIGDLDSVKEETTSYFLSLPDPPSLLLDPDQDATDFAKAVSYIRNQKPTIDVVAMGSLGGRVDQGLSQLHHLYLFQKGSGYEAGRMLLVSSESLTFLLKAGRHNIFVRDDRGGQLFGKHVGIIPVKEASVITTEGLEWDVTDWKTEFGGRMSTSNHLLPTTKVVKIETSKDVIFTIALRQ